MDPDVTLRRLTTENIPAATELSQSAGWNQVPADWGLFLELGEGYGLFAANDGLVGTICLMPYPPSLAWVSLLIVREGWRHRGLGSALMRHALWVVAGHRLTPLLDATPLGRPIYMRLGFRDLWPFQRYVRSGAPAGGGSPEANRPVRPLEVRDLDAACALDAAAFGARRDALLTRMAGRLPEGILVADGPQGLRGALFGRDGSLAAQLGPLTGDDDVTAISLLQAGFERVRGPLQVDVPDAQTSVVAYLRSQGCEPRRTFVRMILGDAPAPGDPRRIYAVAGAELG